MHKNRNPCNSFLVVKMASGMHYGRLRPTTTTMTTTNDVAQHGGHPVNTKSCSLGLQHIYLILTSPHLSSSRSVAHKATLLFLHLSLSLVMALTSSQDFQPAFVLSFSTVRRQVVLGQPSFLLPIGVEVSAVTQWCSLGILRTCPKNLHLLLFTSTLILVHPVLLLSSSIDTM